MATLKEKEELIEALKAVPKTYDIMLSGYGGEIVLGSITKEQYQFWKDRDDFEEHCTDWDDVGDIPDDIKIVSEGQWHDVDNLAHECGVEWSSSNYIVVTDRETGETVFECNLDSDELEQHGVDPDGFSVEEFYVQWDSNATYGFLAQSYEKGCFFTGEVETFGKFDPKKLSFSYIDVEGWQIVNGVSYESIIVDDTGGYSTTGKGLEFKVFQIER